MPFLSLFEHPQGSGTSRQSSRDIPGSLPRSPSWEKLNRGGSKPGCFPLFLGKVQIVSRTLSELFLVGAFNTPRKRKRTNRENPRTVHEQIGKISEKSGKSQKGQKRTKKEGQVQIGKPPRLKHPRLAALDQGKQTPEGGHELFDPYPFAWKTPVPPGSLRARKLNPFVLFFLPDSNHLLCAPFLL